MVGGPPGVLLHTVVDGLPSGETGDMVPVVLPTTSVGMVPNTVPGIIVVEGVVVVVLPALNAEFVPGTVEDIGVVLVEGDGVAVPPNTDD